MHIKTELSANTSIDVCLDKLFQFIVVSNIVPNSNGYESEAKVGVYTCLAISSKGDSSDNSNPEHNEEGNSDNSNSVHNKALHCRVTINGKEADIVENRSHFFLEQSNIRGFWGERSEVKSPTEVDIKALLGNKIKIPTDTLQASKIVYINQGSMKHCISVRQFDESFALTIGEDKFPDGHWLYHEFNTIIDSNNTGIGVKSKIKVHQMKASSPDLRVYFQFPKSFELHNERVEIIEPQDENSKEAGCSARIERVFSQSRIEYYDEWIQGGIRNSNLLRLQENKNAQRLIEEHGIEEISIDMSLVDINKPKEREYQMLLFSLLLSLFCAYGIDATRQMLPGFQHLFILVPEFITSMWLILCCCIGIKLFFNFKKDKKSKLDDIANNWIEKQWHKALNSPSNLIYILVPEICLTLPYVLLGESIYNYTYQTANLKTHSFLVSQVYESYIMISWFLILISTIWICLKVAYMNRKGG